MTTDETTLKQLELALVSLDKDFGDRTVVLMGDMGHSSLPAISTGAFTVDMAIGLGGLPKGRVIEIYGPESAGKTTLALSVVKSAQDDGELCAYIDSEHALDPIYMRAMGVHVDDLYLSQPDYAEAALTVCERLLDTGAFSVIVIDSVAALTPKAELEGDMGQSHVGLQARLMGQALRKLNAKAHKTGTMLIFINQLREKVGVMFGSPETTPGGRALKFYASVRIDVRKIDVLKDSETGEVSGSKIRAKLVKNKVGPPYRLAEFDIVYGSGIDDSGCVLDAALGRGLVKKSGAWFSTEDVQLGQGRAKSINYLNDNPELKEELKKAMMQ